jgi:(R)-2-hydroxyacyl-CoA dehydratese activating ATPase
MKSLGIDIGSRTIKSALVCDDRLAAWEVVDATSRPFDAAVSLLRKHHGIPAMATGYGRHLLELDGIPSVTEIKACAYGVRWFRPDAGTIIDVGGQDIKVITLDDHGKVAKFEMNDRCAAGTGVFLEIMAARLDYPLDEFGPAALLGHDGLTISSLCTVFAESEVVGLLNRNEPRDAIARAVHKSVVRKIVGMFKRIAYESGPVALAGGGVLNPALQQLLRTELQTEMISLENPRICAALGAALLCRNSAGG